MTQSQMISIHSSHTGRDRSSASRMPNGRRFQSTLPIREETIATDASWNLPTDFNPLFPYGKRRPDQPPPPHCPNFNPLFPYGKRPGSSYRRCGTGHFNPLFPYGKRPFRGSVRRSGAQFQSTLPIREETCCNFYCIIFPIFQSTLPIREETIRPTPIAHNISNFNPLFPYGKRR